MIDDVPKFGIHRLLWYVKTLGVVLVQVSVLVALHGARPSLAFGFRLPFLIRGI